MSRLINMMIIIFTVAMSRSTPRKEQTHERIVEVAARAVRREGYAGGAWLTS